MQQKIYCSFNQGIPWEILVISIDAEISQKMVPLNELLGAERGLRKSAERAKYKYFQWGRVRKP